MVSLSTEHNSSFPETYFSLASDRLTQLFEPVLSVALERLPRWFIQDQTLNLVQVQLTDMRSSEFSVAFKGAKLRVPIDRIAQALNFDLPSDQVASNEIPTEIERLAAIANAVDNREKVANFISRELEIDLLHERGHALFAAYKAGLLEMPFRYQASAQSRVYSALSIPEISKKALETQGRLGLDTKSIPDWDKVQKWSDEIFSFALDNLDISEWRNFIILSYLSFIEEIFIRIAQYDHQGRSSYAIQISLIREVFRSTEIDNGYGLSFRIDWKIVDFLHENGVEKTLNYLMSIYSQAAALALFKKRFPKHAEKLADFEESENSK